MYTSEVLLDVHERSHRGFRTLIAHCGKLTPVQFRRNVEGFGYSTVQSQLCHVIGAEMYWVGVLEGRMDVDDRVSQDPAAEDLEAFRREVFDLSASYLSRIPLEELNREREFVTWGAKVQVLWPAQVIMRTQMHIFQHQGQVAAMCRRFGAPIGGIDYPHGP